MRVVVRGLKLRFFLTLDFRIYGCGEEKISQQLLATTTLRIYGTWIFHTIKQEARSAIQHSTTEVLLNTTDVRFSYRISFVSHFGCNFPLYSLRQMSKCVTI